MRSAAFSAIITIGILMFPLGIVGKMDASTTRKFEIPWIFRDLGSTTAIASNLVKWKEEIISKISD